MQRPGAEHDFEIPLLLKIVGKQNVFLTDKSINDQILTPFHWLLEAMFFFQVIFKNVGMSSYMCCITSSFNNTP